MYSIVFTYGCEHEWFNYDSKKEANKKFNALKKRVDEYAAKSIYSSVSMSSVSIYGEEEQTYDNSSGTTRRGWLSPPGDTTLGGIPPPGVITFRGYLSPLGTSLGVVPPDRAHTLHSSASGEMSFVTKHQSLPYAPRFS